MKTVTTVGIDLAKNSFSVYGVDAKGKAALSRTLSRTGVVRFFANLPFCLPCGQAARQTLTTAKPTQGCQERRDGKTVGPAFVKPVLDTGIKCRGNLVGSETKCLLGLSGA
jgi:hypothetical protein